MKMMVGKTYEIEINDCCVQGGFTSKLVKAQVPDDESGTLEDLDTCYGAELFFENGVRLVMQGGVSLTEVD